MTFLQQTINGLSRLQKRFQIDDVDGRSHRYDVLVQAD